MNFILQINVGVVKLTGESGTGKTALLQELVRNTTQAQQDIVVFPSAPSSIEQIRDTIRQQLALPAELDFQDALLNYLLAKPYELRRLTVVFDEAEQIDEQTLLAAGQLRSIQHAGHHLIGIVLCGKPELNRILRNPGHRMLAKDILLSYELSPLSSQQLPDFCRACLAARGLDNFILVSDDYLQIMQKSGGLPGKVAELVETYWPEDPDNTGPSARDIRDAPAFEAPQLPQQFLAQSSAPSQPEMVISPETDDLSFDVLPVVAPDIDSVMTPALAPDVSTDDVLATTNSVFSSDSYELQAEFSDTLIADVSTVITDDGSSNVQAAAIHDVSSDVSTRPSDVQTDILPGALSDVSSDASPAISSGASIETPLDVSSDVPFEVSFDVSYRVLYGSAGDVGDEHAGETLSNSPSMPSAPIEESILADEVLATVSIVPEVIEPIEFASAPFTAPVATITTAIPEPSETVAIESAEPTLEIPAAVPLTPVRITPTFPAPITRPRAIVGSLLAASLVLVITMVYMQRNGTDSGAPELASEQPTPAQPVPAAVDVNVPAVAVQQFGNPPADVDNTPDTTATTTASPTEIVPQPLVAESPTSTATTPADDSTDPAPATAQLTPQNPVAVPAPPTSAAAVASVAESVVTSWITAWQSQDVATYLAFYHQDFVPPNGASRADWENNRSRTITSQSSISIDMEDFRVITNSGNQTTVQFMLTYRGDSYADRTLKELMLQTDASGEMRIMKEQNLRTEAFDPVIEAASSWMRDRTPEEMAAVPADNHEPIVSELVTDDANLLSANTDSTDNAPSISVSSPENVGAQEPIFTTAPAITIPLIFNLTNLTQQDIEQISGFLSQWADAWQTQNTEKYLNHYHPDYKAPELASTDEWREERTRKITTPASISISLEELEIIENNDNNVLVELLMVYLADNYADRTLKRMLLSKTAGSWQITMEKNLEVEKL